jgi:hypothetical protein
VRHPTLMANNMSSLSPRLLTPSARATLVSSLDRVNKESRVGDTDAWLMSAMTGLMDINCRSRIEARFLRVTSRLLFSLSCSCAPFRVCGILCIVANLDGPAPRNILLVQPLIVEDLNGMADILVNVGPLMRMVDFDNDSLVLPATCCG